MAHDQYGSERVALSEQAKALRHPGEWDLPRFPWRGLLLLLIALVTFKPALLLVLGEEVYRRSVEALAVGNPAEQFAAWVMQPDPVTLAIAELIRAA